MHHIRQLGLIGYPLSHSFSKKYFSEKFEKKGISNFDYDLYPLEHINQLPLLLEKNPHLEGLNVTIPYKEVVMDYLHDIDNEAAKVGAVNTIKIENGRLKGYNTDIYGFEISLLKLLSTSNVPIEKLKALVLGTGGAAKAVVFILEKLKIFTQLVSRNKRKNVLTYTSLTTAEFSNYQLIVNTTPLGMSPNADTFPALPYHAINEHYFLYDLIYNPEETLFLQKGIQRGASVKNGLEMLVLQAEKSWNIWTTAPQ